VTYLGGRMSGRRRLLPACLSDGSLRVTVWAWAGGGARARLFSLHAQLG